MQKQTTEVMLERVPNLYEDKKTVSTEATRIYGQTEVKASCSTSTQSDLDCGDHDVLDLERMADKFECRFNETSNILVRDTDIDSYLKLMRKVDYEKLKRTDICLKRAYDLLFNPNMEKYPRLVRKTEKLIARLESQPHLYCPFERVETTGDHVTRWLNNHTANPVAELHGFTSRDPYEPKRFIPTLSPRVSHSDTNVLLGKRKRNDDYEADDGLIHKRKRNDDVHVEGGLVYASSSDTRLICDEYYRPVKRRRRF